MEAENGQTKTIYFRINYPKTPSSRGAAWPRKKTVREVCQALEIPEQTPTIAGGKSTGAGQE